MAESSWKRHERQVARLLGGARQPNTGRRGADVLAGEWAIEVKVRRELPKWLTSALAQAEAAARETGRLPLLVLVHTRGRGRRARRYALLPLSALPLAVLGAGEGDAECKNCKNRGRSDGLRRTGQGAAALPGGDQGGEGV